MQTTNAKPPRQKKNGNAEPSRGRCTMRAILSARMASTTLELPKQEGRETKLLHRPNYGLVWFIRLRLPPLETPAELFPAWLRGCVHDPHGWFTSDSHAHYPSRHRRMHTCTLLMCIYTLARSLPGHHHSVSAASLQATATQQGARVPIERDRRSHDCLGDDHQPHRRRFRRRPCRGPVVAGLRRRRGQRLRQARLLQGGQPRHPRRPRGEARGRGAGLLLPAPERQAAHLLRVDNQNW